MDSSGTSSSPSMLAYILLPQKGQSRDTVPMITLICCAVLSWNDVVSGFYCCDLLFDLYAIEY